MFETALTIEGMNFPQFSARGCVQELTPVVRKELFRRTINHELIYLGKEGEEKYISKITCQDQGIPEMAHLWRGSIVKVGCLATLSQPLKAGEATLAKPYVLGSLDVLDKDGEILEYACRNGKVETMQKVDGIVRFRPILTMAITNFSYRYDEWGGKVGWQIELEEV